MLRLRTVSLGVVLAALAVFLAPASPASAHAALVSTNPPRGAVLPVAPSQVVLTFTEAVKPVAGKVRVIGPDGSRIDNGQPRSSSTQLIIPLRSNSPRGTYLVSYRVTSADSHPIAGSYSYSVGAPSPGGPPNAPDDGGNAGPAVSALFPVVRWLGYIGLLLMVGGVLVLTLLWPNRLDRTGPIRTVWVGAGLIALATIDELALQVPYVTGGSLSSLTADDAKAILGSQYGVAHLIRLGVLVTSVVLLRPILRGKGWRADRVLLAVLGGIAVATWSVSGHPSGTTVPMVTVVADMVHLAAMAIWVGGLVMLAVFLLPRADETELSAIMPVWSRWATVAVVDIVLTGVVQALVTVGSFSGLVSTPYGQLLLVKTVILAGILGVALLSRRLIAPIVERTAGVVGRLRRLVAVEASVAALVLVVAGVLVQTAPARSVLNSPTIESAVITDKLFGLSVDIQPAKVGTNELHLYATTPSGGLSDVKEWKVKASLPEQGIEPIDAVILPITPDHAVGEIGLPVAGKWTFTFTVRLSEFDQSTVSTTFTIEG